jgi:hypothetical protein
MGILKWGGRWFVRRMLGGWVVVVAVVVREGVVSVRVRVPVPVGIVRR